MKPFRPPLLKNRSLSAEHPIDPCKDEKPTEPFPKRRKISSEVGDDTVASKHSLGSPSHKVAISHENKSLKTTSVLPRKPLVSRNPPSLEALHWGNYGPEGYYLVLWRKPTAKKNKTWDSDGVLSVRDGYARLQDSDGKEMGRIAHNNPLLPGSTLSIGGKDVEIDSMISKDEYVEGRMFSGTQKAKTTEAKQQARLNTDAEVPVKSQPALQPPISRRANAPSRGTLNAKDTEKEKEEPNKPLNSAAPKSVASSSAFRNPLKNSNIMPQKPGPGPTPRHDPTGKGAIVMQRPENIPQGKEVVDVVIDPEIGRKLRQHQIEGVKFLYECVMGIRDFGGEGAILADEMGLGKSLQTITLLWTLLKQNPIHHDPPRPVIKKALIVCPVTLVDNWRKEFRKWLGNERIGVFIADGKKTKLTDFTMGKAYSVMIIGYERLRTVAEDLTRGSGIDIVIADEGHRLKTEQNKSAQAIQSLNTSRRIILSGTPIQNDLKEFFCMVNFVNDGILGSYKSFIKSFEIPILKSRQPNAIQKDIENGEAMSEELACLTSPFILRRTVDILEKFLPPKTEYVLFCNPTPTQASIYRNVLASPLFQFALGNGSESALQLITILKKLCNSPSLLNPGTNAIAPAVDDTSTSTSASTSLVSLLSSLPASTNRLLTNASSAKIRLLDSLLMSLRGQSPFEKIVLVSNYTSTLDILQSLLTSLSLSFLRLDGSTPPSKRQGLVDDFNRPSSGVFAFLLSAKAGGLGLNLIGASRLVLFDVDWNPATDVQAMARVYRQGQKREVRIYRLVMKGTVEERIWMRQVEKGGLASNILELGGRKKGGGALAQFSREELRDLFRFEGGRGLKTHELIGCGCGGAGEMVETFVEKGEDGGTGRLNERDNSPATDHGPPRKMKVKPQRKKKRRPRLRILDSDSDFYSDSALDTDNSGSDSYSGPDHDESLPSAGLLLTTPALTKSSVVNVEEQERLIAAGQHPLQARSHSSHPHAHHASPKAKAKAASLLSTAHYAHFDLSRTFTSTSTSTSSSRSDRDHDQSLEWEGEGELELGDEVLARALDDLGREDRDGRGRERGRGMGMGMGLGLVGWVFRRRTAKATTTTTTTTTTAAATVGEKGDGDGDGGP